MTSENLDCPILGYNVIEELLDTDQNPTPTVYKSFPEKGQDNARRSHKLYSKYKSRSYMQSKNWQKDMIIPKKQEVNVDCHANTGPVEKLTPELFVSQVLAEWPDSLEMRDTILNILIFKNQGRRQK